MRNSLLVRWGSWLFTICLFLVAACGDSEENEPVDGADTGTGASADAAGGDVGTAAQAVEVAGEWESDFGAEAIDADIWGFAELVEFDNDANRAVTRVPDDSEFSPGTYSVNVWTAIADDAFWYCTVAFSLETIDDARASEATADATDPATGGCGDFAWTQLRRVAE